MSDDPTARPTIDEKNEVTAPALTRSASKLDRVTTYAGLGWLCIPVIPNEKPPAVKGWREKATLDPAKLATWFGPKSRDYNVGIVTGAPSGFFALDIDPRNGGDDSLDRLQDNIGRLPDTVMQQTAGGGWHYFFKMPADRAVGNGKLADYPGIDFKGTGGYVVADPSKINGKRYTWEVSASPGEIELAEAPAALLVLVVEKREQRKKRGATANGTIPEGERNTTLTRRAGRLRRTGLGEEEIRGELLALNSAKCTPPLPDHEVETIARSICTYEPGTVKPVDGGSQGLDTLNRTDLGNAERLITRHGKDLRYCPHFNGWLMWDGVRWCRDPGTGVAQRAIDTIRDTGTQAAKIPDLDDRAKLVKHALASERAERLRAMAAVAGNLPGVAIQPDDLDRDTHLINVQNGTVELRTQQLREHRREDLITRVAPVAYSPSAQCPTWLKFLDDVLDGDSEMVAYLRRAAGLSLSGDTGARVLFILQGAGHNGKSTFLETLRDVTGDYAGDIPPGELMQVKRQDHGRATPFLVRLQGTRLVTAMETEENEQLASSLVKGLTGGRDVITVRELYGKAFSYRPQFKLWIATNHPPRINDTTSSIWGRIHTVPFTVHIPDPGQGELPDAKGRKKDPKLDEKLARELPGIFAWMVEGFRDYQEGGLRPPQRVLHATAEYREQEDTVGRFIGECLESGEECEVSNASLRSCLERWCAPSRETVSLRSVANRLKAMPGVATSRCGRARGWRGVRIREGAGRE